MAFSSILKSVGVASDQGSIGQLKALDLVSNDDNSLYRIKYSVEKTVNHDLFLHFFFIVLMLVWPFPTQTFQQKG